MDLPVYVMYMSFHYSKLYKINVHQPDLNVFLPPKRMSTCMD